MVEHLALRNRIDWMQNQYQLEETDVVLQKTPYSFDVSVWEFIWPLVTGAKLVLAKPEGHKDPEYLSDLISTAKVSVLHFVPSMLSAYLESTQAFFPKSIRLLFCSGEALRKQDVLRIQQSAPQVNVHNLYGPTEAAIDVTSFDCGVANQYDEIPIGRPIQNSQLYILDNELRGCPYGAEGELYIGGDCLARGYLNKPELTNNAFISNPFFHGARLYRTGDRVRYLEDENIEYLGRCDTQVKLRGQRIELGEIENQILSQNIVTAATVVVRNDVPGGEKIVAYVVPTADQSEVSDFSGTLIRALSQRLPEYMVPSLVMVLDSIPLTHSGKTDHKLLPIPDVVESSSVIVAPKTNTERILLELWSEFFDVPSENLSAEASFFELGGDSISAISLVSRIKTQLKVELPLAIIFEHKNIISVANWLENNCTKQTDVEIKRLSRDQLDDEELVITEL